MSEVVNDAAPRAPRIRPGLCSVTLRDKRADEVIDHALACGLEGIEWGGDVHAPSGLLAEATAIARRCRDEGVECPSYGSYLGVGAPADRRIPNAVVLDTAEALGAGNVRVWTDWASVDETDDRRRSEIAAELAAVAADADARELTVSLEFHAHTLTQTAASTLRLLDEAARPPNLFTYWQPMAGVPVATLVDELRAVHADLSHLHVFRWTGADERLPLSAGEDLWPEALATIVGDDSSRSRWQRDRFAFLEFVRGDDPMQLHADADVLRGWLARSS